MSLFDHVMPSERAAELELAVRRVRRRTGLGVVAMLIVEGRTDEPAFGAICCLGQDQVFSAGTRGLVEQMLLHLDSSPIAGCECAYLVDCDGTGKTVFLRHRDELVVTETCDVEADLIKLGVATRVARRFVATDDDAATLVREAVRQGLPLSIVRRAAHRERVSMKINGRQARLDALPESVRARWETSTPGLDEIIDDVAAFMEWTPSVVAQVRRSVVHVPRDFETALLGRDGLDALFRLLRRDGTGEVRGWSRDHFLHVVRRELHRNDTQGWKVAGRLKTWAGRSGHELIRAGDAAA